MKKFNYAFVLLLLILYIPRVYAFTFEMNTSISSTSVKKGTTTEIRVSLNNIQGTSDGIAACYLNIDFDDNIILNSEVRTLGSWSMEHEKIYLFDTGKAITNTGDMFVIPVKVNGEGSVKLSNIVCSDGNTNAKLDNKNINFTIVPSSSNNNVGGGNQQQGNNNQTVKKDSNCDLSNIELSEGTIEFDSAITEYSIEISSIDDLVVTPILSSDKATYDIIKNNNNVVITVRAEDGSDKVYTIYVEEVNDKVDVEVEKKSNYTPIFIVIIVVLVLINVIRIVINMKKNKKELD